jgi:plasmid stabilization system protein ParE
MTTRWTPTALRDIASLHAYIAEDNPGAASGMVDQVVSGIAALAGFLLGIASLPSEAAKHCRRQQQHRQECLFHIAARALARGWNRHSCLCAIF